MASLFHGSDKRALATVVAALVYASASWTIGGSAESAPMSAESRSTPLHISESDLAPDILAVVAAARRADAATRSEHCIHLAGLSDPGARGLVLLMRSRDENLRWEAVAAAAQAAPSDTISDALRAALADPSWAVRSEAARSLGIVGGRADVSELRRIAESDPEQVVRTAARQASEALATRPDEAPTPTSSSPPAERRRASALPIETPSPAAHGTGRLAEVPLAGMSVEREFPTLSSPPAAPETPPSLAVVSVPSSVPTAQPERAPVDRPHLVGSSVPRSIAAPDMRRQRRPKPADVMLPALGPEDGARVSARVEFAEIAQIEVLRGARTVDAYIDRKIAQVLLPTSSQANDGEFARRLWLDLTGVIPTAQDATEFVLTGAGGNRPDLIDRLTRSDAYFDHWADVWTQWLVGSAERDSGDVGMLRQWLRDALEANMPYDLMVRHLLTTEGPTHEDGAANYLLRFDLDPIELAARTSRVFLGLPMQCAECHDHKTERWKQADFYGVAAFFNSMDREEIRIEVEEDGEVRDEYVGSYLRDRPVGPMWIPGKETSVDPAFLTGESYRPTL